MMTDDAQQPMDVGPNAGLGATPESAEPTLRIAAMLPVMDPRHRALLLRAADEIKTLRDTLNIERAIRLAHVCPVPQPNIVVRDNTGTAVDVVPPAYLPRTIS